MHVYNVHVYTWFGGVAYSTGIMEGRPCYTLVLSLTSDRDGAELTLQRQKMRYVYYLTHMSSVAFIVYIYSHARMYDEFKTA